GDVMKESAQAAASYARANADWLEIDPDWFDEHQVHIHLPAGAIPKDGPSAGVTLSTALISLATGVPVKKDVAMTGEITLSGRVLPVGGIREKCLAALTHGVSTVILPLANKKDVVDIPEDFKKKMNFIFVENLDEVFAMALDRTEESKKPVGRAAKKGKPTSAAA
ncbi:MAG TPA: endopeptidase La, partial [Bdellovibrionales bacterium]|nr:endopeptidase La [Bdellovibrionales bacterium]